jgi:hypothetical protein
MLSHVRVAAVFIHIPVILLLSGCAYLHLTAPPAFEASVQELPKEGDTVVLFPADHAGRQDLSRTEREAAMWLRDHGLIVIERPKVDRLLQDQRVPLIPGHDSAVLQTARSLGASEVIFLEETIGSIYLRSVRVETGQVLWTGSGKYVDPCFDPAEYVFKCTRNEQSLGWNFGARCTRRCLGA